MDITTHELNDVFLKKVGVEASSLLVAADYGALATRFGYALNHGREPKDAICTDVAEVLAELKAEVSDYSLGSIEVKYFKANSANLTAVIECVLISDKFKNNILLNLIVAGRKGFFINRQGKYSITIEGISIIYTA